MITLISKINEFWNQHCDPYLIQLPLFHSPLTFLACLLISCVIVLLAQHYVRRRSAQLVPTGKSSAKTKSSSSEKPTITAKSIIADIRPLILVHNGFCFGVYGVGLLIMLTQTYFGQMLFSCDPSRNITVFHQHCIKHTVYTYLIVTFACFLQPLITVLGGREVDIVVDLLHQTIWSLLLTVFVVLNPVGIPMTIVVIDAVHNVIRFGAAVLSIQQDDKSGYNKACDAIRIFTFSLVSAFSYHAASLIQERSCRPPVAELEYQTQFFFPIAVYAAIVCAVSVFRLASRFLPTHAIEKQVLSSGRSLRKSVRLTKIPAIHLIK